MDTPTNTVFDPLFVALRHLPPTLLLSPNIAEALLHLPSQTFDVLRARQQQVPQLTIIDDKHGYTAGDLVQFIEQDPTRCGPICIRHASFQDFLANGLPDDVWVFGMVALDFQGMRRPVDLLTCLELPMAVLADTYCKSITLKDYVKVMGDYLFRFDDQKVAEAQSITRLEQARGLTPGARSRSRAHHS